MLGGFIIKAVGWLRWLFGWNKYKERETPSGVDPELPPGAVTLDKYVQARRFLYEGGCPVGRPHSRHPDIRRIYVKSFSEAYCFFLRLCDQRQIAVRQAAGSLHYEVQLSDKTVIFDLTDKIHGKAPGTLAVLKINTEETDMPIKEIEFVQPKIKV